MTQYKYTMPEGKTEVWAICDAPAGGCGNGRRRRMLTKTMTCVLCGSQMRLAASQTRRTKPALTKMQRRALASIAKATDATPPLCYAICPTKERRRKDVESLRAAGLIRPFDSGLAFARRVHDGHHRRGQNHAARRAVTRAVECHCGLLHAVRWSEDAGIDGAYVYVCPDDGIFEFGNEYQNPPGRVVTDLEEDA